jgi:hypothetical protein
MNRTRTDRPSPGIWPSGARWVVLFVVAVGLLLGAVAQAADPGAAMPREKSPEGARVYIISPKDGKTVTSPVTIRFGLKGMGVAPAGVAYPNTGHHHLIVDAELPDPTKPVPSDEHHIHFGKGQTQVTLDLPPGQHTLQLVLGDKNHVPHDPPVVSKPITIIVK